MGDRYFLDIVCPQCGHTDVAYYAPTSGLLHWYCPYCIHEVDLELYSGINAESTARTVYGVERIQQERTTT